MTISSYREKNEIFWKFLVRHQRRTRQGRGFITYEQAEAAANVAAAALRREIKQDKEAGRGKWYSAKLRFYPPAEWTPAAIQSAKQNTKDRIEERKINGRVIALTPYQMRIATREEICAEIEGKGQGIYFLLRLDLSDKERLTAALVILINHNGKHQYFAFTEAQTATIKNPKEDGVFDLANIFIELQNEQAKQARPQKQSNTIAPATAAPAEKPKDKNEPTTPPPPPAAPAPISPAKQVRQRHPLSERARQLYSEGKTEKEVLNELLALHPQDPQKALRATKAGIRAHYRDEKKETGQEKRENKPIKNAFDKKKY